MLNNIGDKNISKFDFRLSCVIFAALTALAVTDILLTKFLTGFIHLSLCIAMASVLRFHVK